MQTVVDVVLPDDAPHSGPAQAWWEAVKNLLEVAPHGVRVGWRGAEAPHGEMVGIHQLFAFFTGRVPSPRVKYNARMVFYWLIENIPPNLLYAHCVFTGLQFPQCACDAHPLTHYWEEDRRAFYGMMSADNMAEQHNWVISRASLFALPQQVVEMVDDVSPVRRKRVLEYLLSIQGQ